MLMEAYLYEAFAAHFLTDLFSAGHIRAPRRQFHCTDTKVMALSIGKHPIDLITGHTNEVPIWDHQNRYVSFTLTVI